MSADELAEFTADATSCGYDQSVPTLCPRRAHAQQTGLQNTSTHSHDCGQQVARVYDRIGRLQDTQNVFERPALDRLIATGRFETATSVFELGPGTGSWAQCLLSDHLAPTCTYLGVDVSARMVELARQRLAAFADRARVIHSDGTLPPPAANRSADRFIAA